MKSLDKNEPIPIPGYSDVLVDENGNTFRPDGSELHQFNSSGYKQIIAHSDETGKRRILGVHQAMAMTFLQEEYYPGCVVHHIDEVKHHNNLENLKVESMSEHSRHHADPSALIKYAKEHGPVNKGQKMSDEFREHCRISALKRAERERAEGIVRNTGHTGGKGSNWKERKETDPEAYARFCESCRQAALKREAKKREEKENNNNK